MLIPIEYSGIEIMSNNCFLLERINNKNTVITRIYNPKNKKEYGPYIGVKYYNDKTIIVNRYIEDNIEDIGGLIDSNMLETYIMNISEDKLERKSNLDDYYFPPDAKFHDNYIIATKFVDYAGTKAVVLDNKGNEVITPMYDSIENIDDRLLFGKLNNSYNLLTIDSKTILSFLNINVLDIYLEGNIIVTELANDTVEYYNLQGDLIYKTTNDYSYVDYIGDNKYILNASDKCVYMDLTNNISKKEIDYSYCDAFMGKSEQGYIVRSQGKDNYLYNNKLEQIFDNAYDDIILQDDYCIVEKDGKYKILSYNEELLIDKEFSNYWIASDSEVILSDSLYNKFYFKY